MLKARLTCDNQWIIVESDNAVELKQLKMSFTKKINDWYIIKKKAPYANVDETFMNSYGCLLYTSPSPRDYGRSRMPSSA